MVTATVWGETS